MKPSYIGKVRDVYDLGDSLILCSTDRVSAFDVVFNETIPEKGKILNSISNLWFSYFKNIKNHIVEKDWKNFPKEFSSDAYFENRSVLVRKCKRIDFECVVRGYLSGSGYKEYKETGKLAFREIEKGLLESSKLSEPVFTPAIKKDSGHDENISEKEMERLTGSKIFHFLKNTSIHIYTEAAKKLEKTSLILADTKFEFGILNEEIYLIDELLTPDSSRYWEKANYKTGVSPPSFDKQILRNYLEKSGWNKTPPPPSLPESLIITLQEKYKKLESILTECLSEK
ncbi:MAG: phosphoribosylaminoimidazolesuccinocarboxamide synthase [Leptospiraceae bacterium]|nr:phosphoribosylaminoimidazolesuccinocarboxamide synthase [Leptospiraceae bacterium]MCK6380502.1 phosphoribosylaminoimidazolesuccinocarboxamide synthase [Leptospiraceae bacterium]NUM42197.1 phosphoribosylaminoimidazolesuccinocarboxamide synthase [Leptospiraceae bacterium]